MPPPFSARQEVLYIVLKLVSPTSGTERDGGIGRAQTSDVEGQEFEPQPSQTNDLFVCCFMPQRQISSYILAEPVTYKIYICCYLAWYSALTGSGKDWLEQYQDNVTGVGVELGLCAGGLVSQWNSTIILPRQCTVTRRCPSKYDLKCC